MKPVSITDRLIKGTAWLGVSRIIVNALSVLSTVLLARLLAPADFGLIALATTILLVMSDVTELSLSQALVRHSAPTRAHFDSAWTLNALRGLILGSLIAAAGVPAAKIYADPRLIGVMAALGFSLLLGGLANPRRIMLQRDLIFRQEFVLDVAQKLSGVVASILIAYVYRTYWALVIGTLVSQLTLLIVSYMVLPFRPRVSFAHSKELFSFSIWLTAVQVVNTLNWRFDYLFVGKLLGPTALGHYSVGSNFAAIPTRETTAPLKRTIFPGFASIQHDRVRLAAAYQRAQALVTAIALPAGIGAALIADPLIKLALGPKWEPVIFIMQALASVYAIQTLGSLVDSLAMAQGNTRTLFIRSLQMLIVRIPIIIAGMLWFGLEGVITARVITGLLATALNMHLVRRFTGLTEFEQISANFRALASVCVMAAGAIAISRYLPDLTDTTSLVIKLVITGGLSAVLYCGTTLILWLLAHKPSGPEQEIQRVIGKLLSKLRRA